MSEWHLYLIRLKNNHLYTGISKDVEARFCQHCAGGKQAAKFLRGKGPLKLVFQKKIGDKSQALKAEARVKKLSKADKEQLVQGRLELNGISGSINLKN
jgi:putative endonuclease